MLREFGRYQGDIQHFELYSPKPKRTDRKQGFYFTAVCEWLPDIPDEGKGGWLSVCEKCHSFRCLKIYVLKKTWKCLKCGREGTFEKPEQKSEKKTDKPAESESKGKMNREKKPAIDYKKMQTLAKQYHQKLPQGIRELLREERGLTDKIIDKHKLGYCEQHPEYKGHRKSIIIPVYKNKKIVNIRYHSLVKNADPKILPYTANLPDATWLYPESELEKDTLCLVEGELDALCAISQGLPAITRTCGALVWKSEFNKHFKDKIVNVIQDCDEPGREGAKLITQELIQISTKEIRIVDLDARKKNGYDLTDWFVTEQRSTEELLKKIKTSPVYVRQSLPVVEESKEKKEKELAETYKAMSLTDFLKKTPAEIPYLIGKGLLPKQGYLMIAGKAKEGKTKLALMFALCLALGLPIFVREDNLTGMFPTPEKIKTLYLYREAEGLIGMTLESQIKGLENLFKIKIPKEARDRISLKYPPKELYLDMIPGRVIFENIIKANPVDLVVIDPLSKFVARDMNKQPPVIATANLLEEIGRDYNCSFILIHHMNKEPTLDPFDAITGASAWRNCYSSGLVLQRRYEARADVFKKVTFEFRNALTPDFITTRRDNETSLFFEVTEEEALRGISNVERLVKMIEDNFKEPVSYTKIKDLVREKWGG